MTASDLDRLRIRPSVIGQLDKLITIINTSFFPFMGPALLGKFPR